MGWTGNLFALGLVLFSCDGGHNCKKFVAWKFCEISEYAEDLSKDRKSDGEGDNLCILGEYRQFV